MSEQTLPAETPAVWTANPLLSGRAKVQTPHFLRTQWDEVTARSFGPWRVAEPVEPTHTQTLTALPSEAAQAAGTFEDMAGGDATHEEASPPEATSTLSDANLLALREQAFQEGLQQGVQEGLRQAREQWEAERQKESAVLRHLGIELRGLQQDPQRFFEPIKRLSLHIAEQWVRGELQVSGRVVDQLIRQCLAQLEPGGQKVHVELNPADMARLQALGQEACADLELHADAQLREGSVRVRIDETVVQDLIEHRLEPMARKLLKEPDAWLQQSTLLHPDKVTEVDDQEAMRKWTRRTQEVEDVAAKPPTTPDGTTPPQETP